MPRIKGFDEIELEIASHKGKIAVDEWANFSRIFVDIYQKNRSELTQLLEEPSKNDKLSMELFQNVRPPIIKNMYTNEVLRSIFNYLSSLSSLVDVGLRLTRNYSDAQMEEYDKHKAVIVNSDINAFFGKLRNYIQHYGIPPIGWVTHLNEDKPNDCTYFLSKDKLLGWNEWGSKAKSYVLKGDVDLLESIRTHGKMIDEAYGTLLRLSSSIHSADMDEVNILIRRRNDILSGKIPIVDIDD
ncbi:MAG: hypothetical protein JWO99_386 [Candidatus Saccharibacteria bacterium]|nr:hypothetical protein [Candidatus Saccharibacteria bacterium]